MDKWMRFRTLLSILMTLCGVCLGWYLHGIQAQEDANANAERYIAVPVIQEVMVTEVVEVPQTLDIPHSSKQYIADQVFMGVKTHQYWADRVLEEPELIDIVGDRDWHLTWVRIYEDVMFYLQHSG